MSTLSKVVDISSLASLQVILQRSQKDDLAFLAFAILSGIFYNFYIREKPDPYHHVWFEKPQQTDGSRKVDTRDIASKLEETVSIQLRFSTGID